jgi:hypothetical protein
LLIANGAAPNKTIMIQPAPPGYDFFTHVRAIRAPVVDSSAFTPMSQAARDGPTPLPLGQTLGATIYFTPNNWHRGGIWDERVVFFHELVHAYRMVAGEQRLGVRSPHTAYPHIEEFYAVAAANVYRSQLRVRLRKGYRSGSGGVDPVFQDLCSRLGDFRGCLPIHTSEYPRPPTDEQLKWLSCRFANQYRQALEAQAGEPFFRALSRLRDIPFNPFADLRSPRVRAGGY